MRLKREMRRLKYLVPWAVVFCLLVALVPFAIASADDECVVSIDVPAEAPFCTNITARVNIENVTAFDTYQFKLSYDPTVLEVIGAEMGPEGVTDGLINSSVVDVFWAFSPVGTPGVVFILGDVVGTPPGPGASGDGYLCDIHFHVIGSVCNTSDLTFDAVERKIFDISGSGTQVPVSAWIGASVHVSPEVTVSIDVPAEAPFCTNITARVNIENVTAFDTYQFKLSYDPTVLEVIGAEMGPEGVTDGLINSTVVDVFWAFQPIGTPGVMMILGNAPGVSGVNGTGYLCEVHFHVIGSACNTSDLNFSEGMLFDTSGEGCPEGCIPADWIDGSVHVSPPPYVEVEIDIKPQNLRNFINPKSKGMIPVAILTTPDFDASTVHVETVRFGADGAVAMQYAFKDVDKDGDVDMILRFKTQDTGISPGDTQATLTGQTLDGTDIIGADSVRTVPAKGKGK